MGKGSRMNWEEVHKLSGGMSTYLSLGSRILFLCCDVKIQKWMDMKTLFD